MPVLTKKQVERINVEVKRLRLGVLALDELLKKRDAEVERLKAEVACLHAELKRREDDGYAQG